MPKMSEGLFLDSQSKPTTYYNWTAAIADTISSRHLIFPNPPYEVGLYSLVIKTTDSGGGTPTITPQLYFGIDNGGTYYDATAIAINNVHAAGNTTFTSGGTFVARLDSLSKWTFNNGFKITLTRNANSALVINYAEVIGI